MDIVNALMLYALGFAGLFAHWAKRWLRGQTGTGFLAYLTGTPTHTAYSIITMVGAITALLAQQGLDLGGVQTWAMAFTAGYTIDSMTNKDPQDV